MAAFADRQAKQHEHEERVHHRHGEARPQRELLLRVAALPRRDQQRLASLLRALLAGLEQAP